MAASKEKKIDISKEFKKLKPIQIKELKKESQKKEAENLKEQKEESKLEEALWQAPTSKTPKLTPVMLDSAPTLKPNAEMPFPENPEPQNLENQIKNMPTSKIAEANYPGEYVLKAASPKYEAGEYASAKVYESFEQQKETFTKAREMGMVSGLTARPSRAPVIEQRRAINLAAWEVENPTMTAISHSAPKRVTHDDYILQKKEKKEKSSLPFD